VRESGTWALVDPLAHDLLGGILVLHRRWAERLDSWAADESFWVRRAALLSQARPLAAGGSFARFGAYADAMLEEHERFVAKAIGWVLREASRTRGDEVHAWLLPRAARAAGVTIREAVKHLTSAQRDELLAAWAARPPNGRATAPRTARAAAPPASSPASPLAGRAAAPPTGRAAP
jgi:3-methyladenine DNA glycosylase AlkD